MTPQQAVEKAEEMARRAEVIMVEVARLDSVTRYAEPSPTVVSMIAAAQVSATLAEAYARIASATVVLATSEHFHEETQAAAVAAVAGMPGVRA